MYILGTHQHRLIPVTTTIHSIRDIFKTFTKTRFFGFGRKYYFNIPSSLR